MWISRARTLTAALAAAGLLLGACGSPRAAPTPSGTVSSAAPGAGPVVVIRALAFNPPAVTATVGEAVTWAFDDNGVQHTVTADDGAFDSGARASGTFRHTFTAPGTVTYHCAIHAAMTASVSVLPAG